LAYLMYIVRVDLPGKVAALFRPIHAFFYNKWYFDELYNFLFVKSSFLFGKGLWKGGDQAVIDGLGPDGVAAMTRRFSRGAGRLQSGYLYHYAFAMMIGVVALVSWYMFTRAG
ncbi:MAG: NADH-quinone oxidoreductase subunit L, partial [Pseudomonadota bacterium]